MLCEKGGGMDDGGMRGVGGSGRGLWGENGDRDGVIWGFVKTEENKKSRCGDVVLATRS